MPAIPRAAQPGAFLATSTTVQYLVPPGANALVLKVTLTNVSATNVTCTLFLSATTSVPPEARLQQVVVPAGATFNVDAFTNHLIPTGGTLQGQASVGSAVIIKISVMEITP